MLGVLIKRDIVDKDLAIMGFAGVTAVRCWFQLAPFIRIMQPKRGIYAEYYEDFAHECVKEFGKRHIEVKLDFIEGDLVGLIQKLPEEQRPRNLKDITKQRKKVWKEEIKKQRKAKLKMCWHSFQEWCRNLWKRVRGTPKGR